MTNEDVLGRYPHAMVIDPESGKPMAKMAIGTGVVVPDTLHRYTHAMVIDEESGKPMMKVAVTGGVGGTVGPQGPKGDKGDAGPQGPKGEKGDSGGGSSDDPRDAYFFAISGSNSMLDEELQDIKFEMSMDNGFAVLEDGDIYLTKPGSYLVVLNGVYEPNPIGYRAIYADLMSMSTQNAVDGYMTALSTTVIINTTDNHTKVQLRGMQNSGAPVELTGAVYITRL